MQHATVARRRLAFVVSHPIQYYVPMYRQLAARGDLDVRVFYTWHAGAGPVDDPGFQRAIAWDIPLTDGYEWESVPNTSPRPGTEHFAGLQNPTLSRAVLDWHPDAVHLTGYNYQSHYRLLRDLARVDIPVMFRGDSHLLSPRPWWWRIARQFALRRVFRLPAVFLYTGKHNHDYYRAFGVPESKLFYCPHSIDAVRFLDPRGIHEAAATEWRRELSIADDEVVILFAGKLQEKKQPLALIEAVARAALPNLVLVIVGDGELRALAERQVNVLGIRTRFLPFQNQSRMPVVYRLADLFVLPSNADETWGLAVNEAMACGRPALVSDQVGCVPELIKSGVTGDVFPANAIGELANRLVGLATAGRARLREMGHRAEDWSSRLSVEATCAGVLNALAQLTPK
ncbi:MAG: glycosyltransferase family 4 protein [Planctomycetes bacterium]|nr:glycosyltransferase family 4 protein [Planctomycetota bacterium]